MRTTPSIRRGLRLTIAVVAIARPVQSYVSGNGGVILSRFTDVQCELQMTVGRTPSTAMPPEWAESGGKLGLPLTVEFSADHETSRDDDECSDDETLLGEGERSPHSSFLARPLNEPSFISSNGVETVKVTPGRCSCRSNVGSEQYSFRFFLDFPDGAVKNDVSLPAERIYFMTACWNEDANVIGRAKKWKEDILRTIERINSELEEMDGLPPLGVGFLQRIRRYVTLTERRRKLAVEIDVLEDTFPPDHRLVAAPNNVMFLKEGVIAVKRMTGGEEEYHWVGTFQFRKFSNDSGLFR